MESKRHRTFRFSACLVAPLVLACLALRAPAQSTDKSGPVMLTAKVLEDEFGTNRIQITWNEALAAHLLSLPNFKVFLTASNTPVPIAFGVYDPGTFPAPTVPPTTILTMGSNWQYRANYYIVANGIRDSSSNVVAPNSVIPVTWPGSGTGPLPASASPRLTITRSGSSGVRVSWPTNSYSYALEWTTNVMNGVPNSVAGPWTEVQPLMANPFLTTPPNGTHRLFRLRRTF